MLIVADTSHLNYLVLIGCVDVLPQLHHKVLIPSAVHRELLSSGAPPQVREWAMHLPEWAELAEPETAFLDDPQLAGLQAGEKAALALATARQPIFLLVDEWPARKIALVRDLPVTGTLGILDQAAHRKLVSFRAAIESLKQTSFRYPAALVNRLLAEHSGN